MPAKTSYPCWTVLLLGGWLAGTLFMWAVATQNFRLVDRLLVAPTAEWGQRAAPLAAGDARLLMRYQASEINRLFFGRWGWVQLGLSAGLLWLVFQSRADPVLRVLAVGMAAIAAALQFLVVPEVVELGRLLDFAPRAPDPPQAARFWRLHHSYTGLDLAKWLLGVAAVVRLARQTYLSGPVGGKQVAAVLQELPP